jgi:hypothetical protein
MSNSGPQAVQLELEVLTRIYGLGDWDMRLLLPRLWTVGVGLCVPMCGLCAESDHDDAKETCELCPLL